METLICQNPNCGKEFRVYSYRAKIAKFCSRNCASTMLKNRWKGGKIVNVHGYVLIRTTNKKYIYEHRYVMEQYLKRKLKRNEVIHHKNGIRVDNRLENLELMEKRKHDSMESTKRWKEDPKTFEGKERCNAIITERHRRGQKCRRWKPCPFHTKGDDA